MKILIIEDSEFRQNFFKETLAIENMDYAKDADTGLAFLKNNNYDLILLDHDLVGAKSGSYLTEKWYSNKADFQTKDPIVIIHSMNMEGATKMENYLKGIAKIIERIPFKLIVTKMVDIKEKVDQLMSS